MGQSKELWEEEEKRERTEAPNQLTSKTRLRLALPESGVKFTIAVTAMSPLLTTNASPQRTLPASLFSRSMGRR